MWVSLIEHCPGGILKLGAELFLRDQLWDYCPTAMGLSNHLHTHTHTATEFMTVTSDLCAVFPQPEVAEVPCLFTLRQITHAHWWCITCVCVCLCMCTRETFKGRARGRPTGWSTTSIWQQRILTSSTFKHRLTNEGHDSRISLSLCPLNEIIWSGVSWLLILIQLCRGQCDTDSRIQNIHGGGRLGQVRIIEAQVCLRLSEHGRPAGIQCVFGNNVTC